MSNQVQREEGVLIPATPKEAAAMVILYAASAVAMFFLIKLAVTF